MDQNNYEKYDYLLKKVSRLSEIIRGYTVTNSFKTHFDSFKELIENFRDYGQQN